jgi:CRP/FNR family cyclic AMP-dependent transcriptional regulator
VNENILVRVAAHPFLAGMSAHHIELLANCASFVKFGEGDVIFRAGEPANGFYLIESGTVALGVWVFERGPVTTDALSAGDPLGWSWLFPPYRWHYDARATEPTSAIFFDGTTLRNYCDEDLGLGNELFKKMSQVMVRRLQATRAKLIEETHKTPSMRETMEERT